MLNQMSSPPSVSTKPNIQAISASVSITLAASDGPFKKRRAVETRHEIKAVLNSTVKTMATIALFFH
jgi:hypothetical protein